MMRLLALTLPLLLCSCTRWQEFVPPELEIQDLRLADATLLETTAELRVRLANENPEPMEIQGAAYRLELDGQEVGSGRSPTHLTLPPFESATDRVELHVSNVRLAWRLRNLATVAELACRLRGRVQVEMPYGKRTVTVERATQLELGLPSAPPSTAP
jgi:LEA14-like dessication related protein